jgi:predicted Mrr-cat superfamily restriction endonuclease
LTSLYFIRSDFGRYAEAFVSGGYAAVGWIPKMDLSGITQRAELYPIYQQAHPEDSSPIVIGQQVGQLSRFLLEMKAGDYVLTSARDSELLYFGIVEDDPSYYYYTDRDNCPCQHRRRVKWFSRQLRRSMFSVPFQNTIRSSLTIFSVSQVDEFISIIKDEPYPAKAKNDPYQAVLGQLLELSDREFEELATHLLTALGFEAEHRGKVGDGGVDATGELNIANLAKVKVYVQVKRYHLGSRIKASTVKQLRQSIPNNGQGAFITTADYEQQAEAVATESGFPRIGLVNGRQLVDLLVEHWTDIPEEFQERLGLKPGLVLA